MKINTALILCAGFGKRLNPLTLDTPKPLIALNNVSVLETCINLIESLDIEEIFINTYYLTDQIRNFIKKKNFKKMIVPKFDKSKDDRSPKRKWLAVNKKPNIVIFEGWCVGIGPQKKKDLVIPINKLEEQKDKNKIKKILNKKFFIE